jgi:hypothetical protein
VERELFRLFSEHREIGYVTRRWWFRSTSTRLLREIYVNPLKAQGKNSEAAEMENLFVFSNGFFGFYRRNRIVLRKLTRVISSDSRVTVQ